MRTFGIILLMYGPIWFLKCQERNVEIQLYTAPLFILTESTIGPGSPIEKVGLSIEYRPNELTSITFGFAAFSLDQRLSQVISDEDPETSDLYNYETVERNRFVNFFFKKYIPTNQRIQFFKGGFLRYYYFSDERTKTESYTEKYIELLFNSQDPKRYIAHKLSLGFIAGGKILIREKLTLGCTFGIGASLPFLYPTFEEQFSENLKKSTSLYHDRLYPTIIFHPFIGYSF